jgi:diguanylate cyclase (GGDEF)-like protein
MHPSPEIPKDLAIAMSSNNHDKDEKHHHQPETPRRQGIGAFLALAIPAILSPILFQLYQGGPIDPLMVSQFILSLVILGFGAIRIKQSNKTLTTLEKTGDELRVCLETSETRNKTLQTKIKTSTVEYAKLGHALNQVSAELSQTQIQSKSLTETLEKVSLFCTVTGLPNRRLFDELLEAEWRRLMREKKPLSLILVDLDDADIAQDFYGSDAGSDCLRAVVQVLKNHATRGGDLIVRYGVTQFCVLLINADAQNTARIAEKIRRHVIEQRITHERLQPENHVTIHAGTAIMIPSRRKTHQELIKRIESALYEAKFQGGNKIVAYRALDFIRLERWNIQADGPMSEEGLTRKLMTWDLAPRQQTYQPAVAILDQSPDQGSVHAVLHGQLRITIEGQSTLLQPGDCVFIPAGTTYSSEVVGNEPVLAFDSAPQERRRA